MTREEITQRLEEAAENVWNDGAYRKFLRISKAQSVVEEICNAMQAAIDKQTVQLAEQSAKIYAYEAIIANSNFKAVLPKAKGGEK